MLYIIYIIYIDYILCTITICYTSYTKKYYHQEEMLRAQEAMRNFFLFVFFVLALTSLKMSLKMSLSPNALAPNIVSQRERALRPPPPQTLPATVISQP